MRLNPKIVIEPKDNAEVLQSCEITALHLSYQPHCHTLYTFYLGVPLDVTALSIPNLLLVDELGVHHGMQRLLCTVHYVSPESPHPLAERSAFEMQVLEAFAPFGREHQYYSYTHEHGELRLRAHHPFGHGGWGLCVERE